MGTFRLAVARRTAVVTIAAEVTTIRGSVSIIFSPCVAVCYTDTICPFLDISLQTMYDNVRYKNYAYLYNTKNYKTKKA